MSRSGSFGSFLDGFGGGISTGMALRERYDQNKRRKKEQAEDDRIQEKGRNPPAPREGAPGFTGPTRGAPRRNQEAVLASRESRGEVGPQQRPREPLTVRRFNPAHDIGVKPPTLDTGMPALGQDPRRPLKVGAGRLVSAWGVRGR